MTGRATRYCTAGDLLPCNLRDTGGLPTVDGGQTRPGLIYRSDDLAPTDPARAGEIVRDLDIDLVLDLRSDLELTELGRATLETTPVRIHHLPMSLTAASVGGRDDLENLPTTPAELGEFYARGIEAAAGTLTHGLELLARAERPSLFHCVAGKDRTGVLAAMLLTALGVERDAIVNDYSRTAPNMPTLLEGHRMGSGVVSPERAERLRSLPPVLLDAPAKAMELCLDLLDRRFGSPLGPLRAAGLIDETVASLRERLVETAAL